MIQTTDANTLQSLGHTLSLPVGLNEGNTLFEIISITADSEKGIAMGVISHGIGTTRAFQLSSAIGVFSELAMALSAFSSALLLPVLIGLVGLQGGLAEK